MIWDWSFEAFEVAPLTGYGQAVLDEPIPKKVPFRGSHCHDIQNQGLSTRSP